MQTRASMMAADAQDGSQNRTPLTRSMTAAKSLFIDRQADADSQANATPTARF
jgi:hypothetical protein